MALGTIQSLIHWIFGNRNQFCWRRSVEQSMRRGQRQRSALPTYVSHVAWTWLVT